MATFIEAFEAIEALTCLPHGWDYGRGGPVSRAAARYGQALVQILRNAGATEYDVTPGQRGGVTVFGYKGTESVEIQCFTNGTFDFLFEADGVEPKILDASNLMAITQRLEECGWRSLRSYVSCTQSAMFDVKDASHGQHFVILQVGASPSSAATVLQRPVMTYAHISEPTTTKKHAGSPRYSGEYRRLACRRELA